jgi:Uma2 family endonuclease
MTQAKQKAEQKAKQKFATFEDYLACRDQLEALEGRFHLINGELFALPPESEPNNWIARALLIFLATSGLVSPRCIVIHALELEVPPLQPNQPSNRYPDLVVMQAEHIPLTERRLTITLKMPPPRLIAEVVSPGRMNYNRNLIDKRAQYAAIGVPEYWIIDPSVKTVLVLKLEGESYQDIGLFQAEEQIVSPTFPELALTAAQLFTF